MRIGQSLAKWSRKHFAPKDDFNTVVQNRELHTITASAAAGAAVGAVGGGLLGFKGIRQTESLETTKILDPVFEGYEYSPWAETSEYCTDYVKREGCMEFVDRWHHRYPPKYDERVVGSYEKPRFESIGKPLPAIGAFAGAVIGGLVGIVTGVVINAVRKSKKPDLPPAVIPREKHWDLSATNSKLVEYGFLGGAAGGAVIGGMVGKRVVESAVPETRTFRGPVTVKTEMGLVPERTTTINYENRADAPATVPIYRDLPQYDENGEVLMAEKTEDFANPRFGPWTGALSGAVIGGLSGLALGTTAAVFNRMSHYETAKESPKSEDL